MDCNFTLCKRYLNGNCIKQVGEKCQLEHAKEIIKEYYNIVEIMLLHHKIDTEKSVKLEVKAKQFIRESKMFEDYAVKIGNVLPNKDYKDIYQKKEYKKEINYGRKEIQ